MSDEATSHFVDQIDQMTLVRQFRVILDHFPHSFKP